MKQRHRALFMIALSLCTLPLTAFAETATVFWGANTESDLAGYKVYVGTESGVYGDPVDVGNVTTYAVKDLIDGTYFFAVTAYDTSGNESGKSIEVSKVISDVTAPGSPGSLSVIQKVAVIQNDLFIAQEKIVSLNKTLLRASNRLIRIGGRHGSLK